MKNMISILVIITLVLFSTSCKDKKSSSINNNNMQAIIELEENVNEISNEKEEISFVYEDNPISEFCLIDENENKYCLYSDIREIDSFDSSNYDNYNVYKDWSTEDEIWKWCDFQNNDLYVLWNYTNGAILTITTESPKYKTKSNIKVGDNLQNVLKYYELYSDVYEYNYDNNEYKLITDKEDNTFSVLKSNEGVVVNATNWEEEEIMSLIFYSDDNIINKISIDCLD